MNRVEVNPDLLRWARDRAGLSVAALARRFPKLEAWERGELHPTLKQLERFAKATHTPVGVLVVREVPALVCSQCGEASIEDPVAARLESLVEDARRRQAVVEVTRWEQVAA